MKTKQSSPLAKMVLETRTPLNKENADGETLFPVKLRVTYQRKRRYFKTKINPLSENEWSKIEGKKRISDKLQEISKEIKSMETRADDTIKNMAHFSFDNFRKQFFQEKQVSRVDVYDSIQAYVDQLKEEGRMSTAVSYNCALSSLKSFKPRLEWEDLSPAFLEDYEKFMYSNGKTQNTVGIYLRSLRTIANIAISKTIITKQQYPFGKRNHGKYQIPASQNVKKALTKQEITKIKEYAAKKGSRAEKAKDFWLFSYYINGLNVKDIAYLTWGDIDYEDGMIRFVRKKTERSNKGKQVKITAVLTPFAAEVIEKYGRPGEKNKYVFPILSPKMTEQEIYDRIQAFTKMMNKGMKTVAKDLDITKRVTTYSARHSHATILLQNGASLEMIMDQFKHSSMKVTMNYVDSISDGKKKNLIKNL